MQRIWEELLMTLDAYRILYKGADNFGEKIHLES